MPNWRFSSRRDEINSVRVINRDDNTPKNDGSKIGKDKLKSIRLSLPVHHHKNESFKIK